MVPKIRFTFTTHAFGARGCAHHTLTRVAVGAPAARAECVRLPRARGGVRPTPSQIPLPPSISPRRRARARSRARGIASPPNRTGVSLPPRRRPRPTSHLNRVSFRSSHRARRESHPMRSSASDVSCTSATPAHACTAPQPQLPSPETAPPPEGGLASPRALRPRRRRPQPSGGLHARRSHPAHSRHRPAATPSPHPYLS